MNNNHNQEPPPAGPHPLNNNVPPPMVRPNGQAPCLMEELCQPSINGRGRTNCPDSNSSYRFWSSSSHD
nr:hypothetical protein [Tanacetum cinerariifolium]